MSMPARHLLIAFAGRTSPACKAALAALQLPNLDALLARLVPTGEDVQDEESFSPPHERALAAVCGIDAPDGLIPWAAWAAREAGVPPAPQEEGWGFVTLCHWQVGMSEAVLTDPQTLGVDAAESATLFDAMRPFFAEDGMNLHPTAQPGRWLVRGKALANLPTASIDRAVGQSVAHWMPLTDSARPLVRLQNEMQMLLYTQPVNDERSAHGRPPINSFWLSGTGMLPAGAAPVETPPLVDISLRDAALRDHDAAWEQAWRALDAGMLAQLLAAQRGGASVRLTLCGDRAARHFDTSPSRGLVDRVRGLFLRPGAVSVLESL